jgi:chromosome segregation ATPase
MNVVRLSVICFSMFRCEMKFPCSVFGSCSHLKKFENTFPSSHFMSPPSSLFMIHSSITQQVTSNVLLMNPRGAGEPPTFHSPQSLQPTAATVAVQKELATARSELLSRENLLAQEKASSSQLKTKIASLVEEIQSLKEKRAASNREKKQATEEYQKLRAKFHERVRELLEKITHVEREKLDAERHYQELVTKFHQALDQQQAAEARAEEFKLKYETSAVQLHQTDSELEAVRKELKVSVKQLTDLQGVNTRLRAGQLAAADNELQAKARLEQRLSAQQAELDALRETFQNLEDSSTTEKTHLVGKIQTFEERTAELERYVAQLREHNELSCAAFVAETKEHARRREEETVIHEREVKTLRAAVHSLELEKADLAIRLTSKIAAASRKQRALQGIHANFCRAAEELGQFSADGDELSNELASARAKDHQEQTTQQEEQAPTRGGASKAVPPAQVGVPPPPRVAEASTGLSTQDPNTLASCLRKRARVE